MTKFMILQKGGDEKICFCLKLCKANIKIVFQVWFQNARAKWRRMNANGGATIDNVLGPDDEMKGDDLGSDMSPGPGDCGPNSMISCC